MKAIWTFKRHVFAWMVLSVFAVAYLAFLFAFHSEDRAASTASREISGGRPLSPIASLAERETPRPARNASLEALRTEVAGLRQQIEALKRRNRELHQRIELVESAFGPATSALPPQTQEPRITGSLREKKLQSPALPTVTVSYLPLPEDGFGDELISASPIPVAGVEESTQTLFGVELASDKSADALKKQWEALSGRHKILLGSLEPRRRNGALAGSPPTDELTLIAGPFPNAAGAALLCTRLRAAGTSCKETVFAGEAL